MPNNSIEQGAPAGRAGLALRARLSLKRYRINDSWL
ncbi:hypothetical protein HMF8227_01795 [Saliniradius amylolyticus]|uniref:Uncharacterized protein n=1 Tax=Saliniradius amylolyticus TaxID=2183582 RepID=A0A2S2E3N8_9ALTE|nr:hypothetical protein HMF8227_01795 [Saliniradius amylolyticus]